MITVLIIDHSDCTLSDVALTLSDYKATARYSKLYNIVLCNIAISMPHR